MLARVLFWASSPMAISWASLTKESSFFPVAGFVAHPATSAAKTHGLSEARDIPSPSPQRFCGPSRLLLHAPGRRPRIPALHRVDWLYFIAFRRQSPER